MRRTWSRTSGRATAIANFVDLLRDVGQLFQHNNAGFVLAGRIIEIVTGEGFSTAMRHRLFAPLGLGVNQQARSRGVSPRDRCR
jgi:CubicO group peptidase (beta-lactamase class C family)